MQQNLNMKGTSSGYMLCFKTFFPPSTLKNITSFNSDFKDKVEIVICSQ